MIISLGRREIKRLGKILFFVCLLMVISFCLLSLLRVLQPNAPDDRRRDRPASEQPLRVEIRSVPLERC